MNIIKYAKENKQCIDLVISLGKCNGFALESELGNLSGQITRKKVWNLDKQPKQPS